MTKIYRNKQDGSLWRVLWTTYEYHHGLGEEVTIVTLRASDGEELRLHLTDEDEWNALERIA